MNCIRIFHEVSVHIKLNCCGWEGPKDFAYNNEPIDDSCYERVERTNSGIWSRTAEDAPIESVPTKKMKEDGCGLKLNMWFEDNKINWVTLLASLVALQFMAFGIAMYISSRVKRLQKLR